MKSNDRSRATDRPTARLGAKITLADGKKYLYSGWFPRLQVLPKPLETPCPRSAVHHAWVLYRECHRSTGLLGRIE